MILIGSDPRESGRSGDGLRLAAAMLGMDFLPTLVFVDGGIRCLLQGSLDESNLDYLEAISDLLGIHVLGESLAVCGLSIDDLNPKLRIRSVDVEQLAKMMAEYESVVAF